ncbi:MAG TPA: DEAD/DEAH box helicase [Bacteroidales bacterium]|nr:DEAD/DEAH box helicase [Bacteroidales bacterium]
MRFDEFNFEPELVEGIEAMGFEEATPIQEKAMPPILENKDVLGLAQTGTGKTAAFLLPVVNKLLKNNKPGSNKALVIVPTRELAMQIDQQMEGLSYFTSISSAAVFGGGDAESFVREKNALKHGAEMIICTPGRMIAHLSQNYVDFSSLEYLILDEADRMLDMGFYEDILRIVSYLPKKRQNLLFAATMPEKMRKLARTVLNNPEEINIAISKPAEKILQVAYLVYEKQKKELAKHILSNPDLKSVIVFCSTKSSAHELTRKLQGLNHSVSEIHSDLTQETRQKTLNEFRNRQLTVLVATDVISRGIDVENIELILNYDVPNDGEDYIHRIGRTARAERDGVAITFVSEKDQENFAQIEKLLGREIFKSPLPPSLGEGPAYNPQKGSNKYGRQGRGFKKGKPRRK